MNDRVGAGLGLSALFAVAIGVIVAQSTLVSLLQAVGIGSYIGAGLGPLPATFAVFAGYVVPALFGPAAELLLVDAVLGQLLPGVLPGFGWAALLLAVLVLLNLRGVDLFARLQTVLTFAMLVFLMLTALVAFTAPAAPQPA
jgi:amino acid transporter